MEDRIKIKNIEAALSVIDAVFLNSPQYFCEPLGKLFDAEILLKIETQNPIRSFKGRGAEYFVSQLADKKLICASAGNFGQAMACICRKKEIQLTIYAAMNANPLKIERMKSLGANVKLFGEDFDAAKLEAKRNARLENIRFVEDGQDAEISEGAGTIGLELVKYHKNLDYLLIPLGNGALFNGVATVFKAFSPNTKIIAIQASEASAMIDSWKAENIVIHEKINTIADGIGVRIPIRDSLNDMQDLIDEGILISENSILEAMKLLHIHTGLVVEPAGVVGLSAILENPAKFQKKRIGTIICGGNLTAEQIQRWL